MDNRKIISLRMERQCFINKADETEYIELYRDTQPWTKCLLEWLWVNRLRSHFVQAS